MRHLIDVTDLTLPEIDDLLDLGEDMLTHPADYRTSQQGRILAKQYEQVSVRVAEVIRLLVAWARSDRARCGGGD